MGTHLASISSKKISDDKGQLLNVVEPGYLTDVFLKNPPVGFSAFQFECDGTHTPAFHACFDLLTTVDDAGVKNLLSRVPFSRYFLSYPTTFLGTTTTEYSNYPDLANYEPFVKALLQEMKQRKAQLCVVKDIPLLSPLLSEYENNRADELLQKLRDAGFYLVEGQALAYVSIDFKSIDEYLQRLSKTRRKEFRKKLREASHVQVEELHCGAEQFFDENFLHVLYEMYLAVFNQSEIHFDKLSPGFFRDLLQKRDSGGRVFLYRDAGDLIGFNICFVANNNLVDKYIGFVYPQAREANLYFMSWFYNLEYALKHGLKYYIAGWTDPKVKAALGAKFTMTRHAVYIRNRLLRSILARFQHLFESDSKAISSEGECDGSAAGSPAIKQ